MKLSVQVIVHPDEDGEGAPVVREVLALDRDGLASDTLGLLSAGVCSTALTTSSLRSRIT